MDELLRVPLEKQGWVRLRPGIVGKFENLMKAGSQIPVAGCEFQGWEFRERAIWWDSVRSPGIYLNEEFG